MIIAALFTLLVTHFDNHVTATSNLPTRPVCEDARSILLYGKTVADKAKYDHAETERIRLYHIAVGAWRASHRCSSYMSYSTDERGVSEHFTRNEFGEVIDGPSWVIPRKMMDCSVPGGSGNRWFMRSWETHTWELLADEYYGLSRGHEYGEGPTRGTHVLENYDVKSAICLPEK